MYRDDPSVTAEFTGSLTVTEAGDLLPTRNQFGGVLASNGTYRMPEDERHPEDRELRYLEGREF